MQAPNETFENNFITMYDSYLEVESRHQVNNWHTEKKYMYNVISSKIKRKEKRER